MGAREAAFAHISTPGYKYKFRHSLHKGLVTNYGEGGTKREGAIEVLPYKKAG